MARVNIYLPDDLAENARAEGLNVSRLCREAVEAALVAARRRAWLMALEDRDPVEIDHGDILDAIRAARDELAGTE